MAPWVLQWAAALQDVVHDSRRFSAEDFEEYLRWYLGRTRTRVTYAPQERRRHVPSLGDSYPVHRDQSASMSVSLMSVVVILVHNNI